MKFLFVFIMSFLGMGGTATVAYLYYPQNNPAPEGEEVVTVAVDEPGMLFTFGTALAALGLSIYVRKRESKDDR